MENQKTEKLRNPHLDNLIERIASNFRERVEKETTPSYALLKGHLLIENVLEECLATFDLKKQISRKSFHEKIKILSEINSSDGTLKSAIQNAIPALYSLNEVRNNLAHDLDFQVSEADINKIGINLGSEYILKKYEHGHKEVLKNLLFILNSIVYKLGLIIFIKLEEIKEKKN